MGKSSNDYKTFPELVENELPTSLKKAIAERPIAFPWRVELLLMLGGLLLLITFTGLFAWWILKA